MAANSGVAKALAALINPAEVDAFTPLNYKPHEKQELFHKLSRQRVNSILFGGAAAGGKSCAMMMESIWCAANYPGMSIACIRRTYGELEESFIKELRKRGYARALGAKWNQTDKKLFFPNGSIINFTYAENEIDASRIQGGEYQLICIDEASLMQPAIIGMIAERLRSADRRVPVIGLRLATNPGGVGSKNLRDRFVVPTDWGKKGVIQELDENQQPIFDSEGEPVTIAYIQSLYTDNPYIDAGYEAVLNRIADPNRRKAMRDGDWDAMVGAFFEQWSRFRHVVPYFPPPKEWTRYCGIDYGIKSPFAAIWGAVDNDGRIWIYREVTMPGLTAQQQAQAILAAEDPAFESNITRVADPSMWGDRGTPLSIADIYGVEGCGIVKADNNHLTGYARFHAALNDGPACEYHRSLVDADGNPVWGDTCPMLHVMEETCPGLIEDMPNLPRSKTKPEDAESIGVNDHTIDATRYLIAMAGTSARPVFYGNDVTGLTQRAIDSLREESQTAFSTGYAVATPTPLVAGRFAGNLAVDYSSL